GNGDENRGIGWRGSKRYADSARVDGADAAAPIARPIATSVNPDRSLDRAHAPAGAQRNPYAELLSPLRHRRRDDAGNAGHRHDQRESGEDLEEVGSGHHGGASTPLRAILVARVRRAEVRKRAPDFILRSALGVRSSSVREGAANRDQIDGDQ